MIEVVPFPDHLLNERVHQRLGWRFLPVGYQDGKAICILADQNGNEVAGWSLDANFCRDVEWVQRHLDPFILKTGLSEVYLRACQDLALHRAEQAHGAAHAHQYAIFELMNFSARDRAGLFLSITDHIKGVIE